MDEAIPEVEISRFSSVVVDGEDFVFLHDLEKAFGLRMDECLSVLCTNAQFPLDNAPDALESKLLPLGDSVVDTIAVVCAEVLAAEQALVDEEEFKATQAKLEATRMLAPLLKPPSDDTKLKGVLHGSINLYGKGNLEEDDMEQEIVLAIDEFAARTGGKRKAFGPQSSLAHYLGQLPPGDVVIVHNEFTPQGHFMTWSLKALSKVLCLCTIAQTAHQ
ncbi:hypothetical protein L7F22_060569, partial [Adiantum nelumboides]|nr:hypothetical protein [Adiantum nelumboides]